MNVQLSQSRDPAKNNPEANDDGQTDDDCRDREADRHGHRGWQATRWQRQVCAAPIAILQLNGDLVATGGTIHSASDQERFIVGRPSVAAQHPQLQIVRDIQAMDDDVREPLHPVIHQSL